MNAGIPPFLQNVPNPNDLLYPAVLGLNVIPNAPAAVTMNYVINSSGIINPHVMPNPGWQGKAADITKYTNYYQTVTAVESFDAYVLTQAAVNASHSSDTVEQQLVALVSSSTYIAKIATEELGRVLRQILLFESQNFVLNTQIQSAISNMVTAQAMTNTLLISINSVNEGVMLQNAQGTPMGSNS
jgi:hypothetical protein